MKARVTTTASERPAVAEPALDAVRSALSRPGSPLSPELLAELEERFGTDLREIRLHTDPEADRAARALRARALTVGNDILLARGEGGANTARGRRLLLHEVAHAAQSPPARGAELRIAPDAEARVHEARAERAVAGHDVAPATPTTPVAPGTILPLLQDTVLRPGPSGAADPYSDAIAADIAIGLRAAAAGAAARAQRRLSRMPESDRGAVLARLQTLLTPDQRERFSAALGQAADLDSEVPPAGSTPAEGDAATVPDRPTPAPGAPGGEHEPPAQIAPAGTPLASPPAPAEDIRRPGDPTLAVAAATAVAEGVGAGAAQQPEARPVPAAGDRPAPAPPVSTPEPAGDDAAPPTAVDYGPLDAAGDRALATAEHAGMAAGRAQAPQVAPAAAASAAEAGARAGGADAVATEENPADAAEAEAMAATLHAAAAADGPATAEAAGAELVGDRPRRAETPVANEEAGEQLPSEVQAEPPGGLAPELAREPEPLPVRDPVPAAQADDVGASVPQADVFTAPPPTSPDHMELAPAAVEPARAAADQAAAGAGQPPPAGTEPPGAVSDGAPIAEPTEREPTAADPTTAEPPTAEAGTDAETAAAASPAAEPAAEGAGVESEAGGDCGPESAPGVGGAGGGDSDGGAPEPEPPQAAPDLSSAQPIDALQQAGALPPTRMAAALGGVRAASARSVGAQRDDLAANPPSVQTPEPIPPGETAVEAARGPGHVPRAPLPSAEPGPVEATAPQLPPAPEPAVPAPPLPPAETEITAEQARAVQSSVDEVPVTDPALHVSAGEPPPLVLSGEADPQRARDQHDQLVAQGRDAAAQGAVDVAAPEGEDHVFPERPSERLVAPVAGGSGTAPGTTAAPPGPAAGRAPAPAGPAAPPPGRPGTPVPARPGATAPTPARPGAPAAVVPTAPTAALAPPAPSGPVAAPPVLAPATSPGGAPAGGARAADPRALDAIAQERSAGEIAAATAEGAESMQAGDEQQRTDAANARSDAQTDMDRQIAEDREAQANERRRAHAAVAAQRRQWSGAQRDAVTDHQSRADAELERANDGVATHRRTAERDARRQISQGNREIADKRREAERDARERRESAKHESHGVLGWLAGKVRRFFRALVDGIHRLFDAARRWINDKIQAIANAVSELIDRVRNLIVGLIRAVGDALIAIGDSLLAAFPALRDRFRRAIHGLVDAAVNRVNQLADRLKEGLRRALAALAAALNAVLDAVEAVYTAAIEAVGRAITAAIDAAAAVIAALAEWAGLIVDIAADPIGWLRKLGAAASDGFHNHLWRELKCAVKAWFRSKVEEVLGLPLEIFGMLRRGGLALAEIGHMVWEGLKQSIPGILVQLAIEKILALLIPGAGVISAIIEFLRAAWPTVSRIFAALERFFAFLKAVRSGGGARKFAQMVAAAAVVVLDFLANFLVRRLVGPARPIGGRLSALAQRIMGRLRQAAARVVGVARRAVAAVRRGVRAAGRSVRRAASAAAGAVRQAGGRALAAVARTGGRVLVAIERRMPRLGRALRSVQRGGQRLVDRGRAFVARQQERYRAWRERRRQRRQATTGDRLARAQRELPGRARSLLAAGVSGVRLRLTLRFWRALYRLSSLTADRQGDTRILIYAVVNPGAPIADGYMPRGAALVEIIRQAVRELMTSHDVHTSSLAQRANMGLDQTRPLPVQGAGFLSQIVSFRRDRVGLSRLRRAVGDPRFNPSLQRFYQLVRGAAPIREWQRWFSSRNAFVAVPGARGGSYLNLAQDLRATGHSDREIARAIRGIVQTGTIDPELAAHTPLLSGVTSLMLGRESVRNQTNVAMGAMTLDLIENGHMTFDDAFTKHEPGGGDVARGGRGLFPMSMIGAQGAADRDVLERADALLVSGGRESRLGTTSKADTRRAADARELRRREEALANRWIEVYEQEIRAMIVAEGGEAFADEAAGRRQIDEQVKTFIRRRLAAFYGIREATGAPTP